MVNVARKIGNQPACLANNQYSRSRIPWLQPEFPITIISPARHHTKIQGSGTGAAHTMRSQSEFAAGGNIMAIASLVCGGTRGEETERHTFDLRNMDLLISKICAAPTACRKKLARPWIEDDSRNRLAVLDQSDRHGEHRKSVREIRGSVERIHVPNVTRGRGSDATTLFGD